MPGEAIRIGPFVGGLNLVSDRSSIADDELASCINFELDLDGSLKNRPPFDQATDSGPAGQRVIGSAIFSGTGYIFASGSGSISQSTDGITWTEIATGREARVAIQYNDNVWMPASPASVATTGFKWNPSSNSTVADMPVASDGVIHKERLYLVPGMEATSDDSRLWFSDPADLETWPGTNFIDVSPGDGETLNAIRVYNDNLLMFKNRSTFVLAYDINPAEAILREINPVLGAEHEGCIVQFENVIYALNDDTVYEIVNYDFNPINIKVPFVLDTSVPSGLTRTQDTAVSLIGERLVVRYFAKMYVYGLRTNTWSEWSVTHDPTSLWHDTTRFVKLPNTNDYYAWRNFTSATEVFHVPHEPDIDDTELTGNGELIECSIRTKDYDMADPVRFKRLFWWSAEVLAGGNIEGIATPVSYSFAPTWSQLTGSWGSQVGTWNFPLFSPLSTSTVIDPDNNYIIAKTIKFLKAMRFRKINFQIVLDTDGISAQTIKLFSFVIFVTSKQKTVKQVS